MQYNSKRSTLFWSAASAITVATKSEPTNLPVIVGFSGVPASVLDVNLVSRVPIEFVPLTIKVCAVLRCNPKNEHVESPSGAIVHD